MKARELLLNVLTQESAGKLTKLVIAFQIKGGRPDGSHNFESNAQAISFVSEALPLSHDDIVRILRGRP